MFWPFWGAGFPSNRLRCFFALPPEWRGPPGVNLSVYPGPKTAENPQLRGHKKKTREPADFCGEWTSIYLRNDVFVMYDWNPIPISFPHIRFVKKFERKGRVPCPFVKRSWAKKESKCNRIKDGQSRLLATPIKCGGIKGLWWTNTTRVLPPYTLGKV